MKVDVLYSEGCQNYETALRLIRRIASDLGLKATIQAVQVNDLAEAQRLRFLGSPSVQIDGIDIDTTVRGRVDFVLG